MLTIFKKLLSAFFALLFAAMPGLTGLPTAFTPKQEDILLNLTVISDTHIQAILPITSDMLAAGLVDLGNSKAPIDALIVAGDITQNGDLASIEAFYEVLEKYNPAERTIVATGNHDIGHIEETLPDVSQEQARQWQIDAYNRYTGSAFDKIYYSTEVKGYKFIVLGDQGDDTWDEPDYYEDQIAFLNAELEAASESGLPVFVISHIPVEETNGEEIVYKNGGLGDANEAVVDAISGYDNVIFIAGHMHLGANSVITHTLFDLSSVEVIDEINYISVPSYGQVNRYGIPWSGTGFQLEIYADRAVVRTRNYITGKWYGCYEYSFALV